MAKRKIIAELIEGVEAMKKQREGKLTLRSYRVEAAPLPAVNSKFIRETRKRMRCSRAVFARKLRINVRTLEKWKVGARPRQAESAGGGTSAAGADVSRYAGAAGEGGDGVNWACTGGKELRSRSALFRKTWWMDGAIVKSGRLT